MITRRELLKMLSATGASAALLPSKLLGGMGGGGTGTPATSVAPFTLPLFIPPVLTPTSTNATTDYYDLQVYESSAEIMPGKQTRFIGFNGTLPGPTVRARAGRKVVMTYYNGLPALTLGGAPGEFSIHLHGAHTGPADDGFPTDAVHPGTSRAYTYPNNQLAAPLWYHDHLDMFTGSHVWYGMAGVYLLSDDHENSLGLPSGNYDVPLVIQDRNFDANGQLVYTAAFMGETGNTLLVNGTIQPYFNVANRKYRFRVYNGSNMREYRLALSNGASFKVLGMEGGLLPAPVSVTSIVLAPAERADIVIDFKSFNVGSGVDLRNTLVASTDPMYNIMRFNVNRSETDPSKVPSSLRPITRLKTSDAVATRDFVFGMSPGVWTINGRAFDENYVMANPRLDTTEIWRFTNQSMMNHPVHVHDMMFQVLDINGAAPPATHAGWKDTVVVPPMGNARIIVKFTDYKGKYVLHCHVLEHEDHAMMARFDVV